MGRRCSRGKPIAQFNLNPRAIIEERCTLVVRYITHRTANHYHLGQPSSGSTRGFFKDSVCCSRGQVTCRGLRHRHTHRQTRAQQESECALIIRQSVPILQPSVYLECALQLGTPSQSESTTCYRVALHCAHPFCGCTLGGPIEFGTESLRGFARPLHRLCLMRILFSGALVVRAAPFTFAFILVWLLTSADPAVSLIEYSCCIHLSVFPLFPIQVSVPQSSRFMVESEIANARETRPSG